MNFLQLVENLRSECGVSGSTLMTTANLGGELLRLSGWITDAWNEIQVARQDWKFLRLPFSFVTTIGKQAYTPTEAGVPLLDIWKQDSFWLYANSLGISDQMPLSEMVWDHFREMYIRNVQTAQKPMCYSVHPNKSLYFGPLPDALYTITGEYWTLPLAIAADADTPAMPVRFHKLIVYEAMKKYAGYEGADEVMQRAMKEGAVLWLKLEQDQLPSMTIDGGF